MPENFKAYLSVASLCTYACACACACECVCVCTVYRRYRLFRLQLIKLSWKRTKDMHAFLYFLHFSRTGDIVKRSQRCVIDSSSTLSRDHHVSHVATKEQKRAEGLGILPRQRRCNGIVTLVTSTTPQSLACNCTLSRCLIHGAPERGWDGAGGGGRQGKEERLDGTRREVDGRRRVRPAVLVLIAQMVQFHVIPTQRCVLCCFRAVESDGSLLPHSGGPFYFFPLSLSCSCSMRR